MTARDRDHDRQLQQLNPPVHIEAVRVRPRSRGPFTVHVVREDVLVGGTKQRALPALLSASPAVTEYVYAGPVFGYAQLALAHVSAVYGKRGTLFVAAQPGGKLAPLTARAAGLGAKIVAVPPPNTLRDVQARAEAYCAEDRASRALLPFGLHCEAFIATLERNLRAALPEELQKSGPRRLWLACGSAAILASLARIWPHTHFLAVQVGKKIWPDQLGELPDGSKAFQATLHVAAEKFWDPALRPPPYPSVANYDAKVWQFVEDYGEEGDYVWNVGCDVPEEKGNVGAADREAPSADNGTEPQPKKCNVNGSTDSEK